MTSLVFYLLQNHDLFSNNNINISPWQRSETPKLSSFGKKNVFSFQGCSCVSCPEQSIDSSFLHRHMAFSVILGQTTDREWGGMVVAVVVVSVVASASPGVWYARLFPLNLIKPGLRHATLHWLYTGLQ